MQPMKISFLSSAFLLATVSSQASLVVTGVLDGTLSGGNPKAVIITATADIADLSIFGLGSANNGGGSGGEEFTFPTAGASTGDVFVVAANASSATFFNAHYLGLNIFTTSTTNINGDDAIELFESGSVIDTYGEIDVDGNGTAWEYADGYAVRTGGVAGSFDAANYNIAHDDLVGLDEAAHAALIQSVFNFTPVPEPGTAVLGGIALLTILRRRR